MRGMGALRCWGEKLELAVLSSGKSVRLLTSPLFWGLWGGKGYLQAVGHHPKISKLAAHGGGKGIKLSSQTGRRKYFLINRDGK